MKRIDSLLSIFFSWEQRKFTDFVTFYNGQTYSPLNVQKSGTLVLRSSNVQNGEISKDDSVFIDSKVVNTDNVKIGDIIVVVRNGSRNLIGKHAQIKEKMPNTVIGAFMTGIRTDNPNFVNSLLNTSIFDNEININMGATINQITGYMFSNMEFKIPMNDEQKKIGTLFQNIDNLITLHQRKYMFEKHSWEQRKLEEIVEFYRGHGLSWNDINENGANKCILYGNLYTDYGMVINKVFRSTNNEKSNYFLSEIGDVLIPSSDTTPTGLARASALNIKGIIVGGDINILRPKIMNGSFLSFAINNNREELIKRIKGTTVRHLNNSDIYDLSINVSNNIIEQESIGKLFYEIDNLITLHQH